MKKIFISHKTGDLNNALASNLYDYLQSKGYGVFLDKRELVAGTSWDDTIYNEISESDVLLVMVTADAAAPWIQREVDFARGCRIKILPVVVSEADMMRDPKTGRDNATRVMEALAISKLQYAKALSSIGKPEHRYSEVLAAIEQRAVETRPEQQAWYESLQEKWKMEDKEDPQLNPPPRPIRHNASYAFIQKDLHPHPCRIHLAAGDITRMKDIEILVNSENVYMQMQRVFEGPSVSKTIRLAGANRRGVLIVEDTIQNELNEQIFGLDGGGTPVNIGEVFVTSPGPANGELSRQGIRYLFHVAAIDAHPRRGEQKLDDAEIVKKCVANCFRKIEPLQAEHEGDPLKSIIIPMLGTGNAGLDMHEAAEAVVEATKEYLTDNPDTKLTDIYLNCYLNKDVEIVEQIMDANLRRLTG